MLWGRDECRAVNACAVSRRSEDSRLRHVAGIDSFTYISQAVKPGDYTVMIAAVSFIALAQVRANTWIKQMVSFVDRAALSETNALRTTFDIRMWSVQST
jgi:LPS O-antigen subunit length determinant protein (WzzB/FepE family)